MNPQFSFVNNTTMLSSFLSINLGYGLFTRSMGVDNFAFMLLVYGANIRYPAM